MKNSAKFVITGNIGSIEIKDKVAFIDVCANYRRKAGEDWQDDPHWNRVTVFGAARLAAVAKMAKGDHVSLSGRIKQGSYEKNGQTVYTVDLAVSKIAVIDRDGNPINPVGDDED